MRHRPLHLVAVGALLLAAACSGGDDTPAATTGSTTTTSAPATTTTIDPESVTVDDVQAILDDLDESYGAMIRRLRDDGELTPVVEDWLTQLFVDPELSTKRSVAETHVEYDFLTLRDDPQGPDTEVRQLLVVTPYCIYAEVTRSYEPVIRREVDPSMTHGYLALAIAEDGERADPDGRQLPPWRIGLEGQAESGAEPGNPCAG